MHVGMARDGAIARKPLPRGRSELCFRLSATKDPGELWLPGFSSSVLWVKRGQSNRMPQSRVRVTHPRCPLVAQSDIKRDRPNVGI